MIFKTIQILEIENSDGKHNNDISFVIRNSYFFVVFGGIVIGFLENFRIGEMKFKFHLLLVVLRLVPTLSQAS